MSSERSLLIVAALAALVAGCVAPLERTQPAAQVIAAETLALTRTLSGGGEGA